MRCFGDCSLSERLRRVRWRTCARWHTRRAKQGCWRTSGTSADAWLRRRRRRSNVTRKLNTPGGKLVMQYTAKKAKGPQTPVGDQGRIHGVRPRAVTLQNPIL